ncbi:hypothetical protein C8Q80DRAFT_1070816, partial [Daedaleopsis nitida]
PFTLVALLMTSALHTLSGLNRVAANLILVTICAVLAGAFLACNTPLHRSSHLRTQTLTPEQQTVLNSIPCDVRTALKYLKVESNIVCYATC